MGWEHVFAIIAASIGLAGITVGFILLWTFNRLDRSVKELSNRMGQMQHSANNTKKSLQESINQLDKRLYGVETLLHMKDCCVLKQDQDLKKAE